MVFFYGTLYLVLLLTGLFGFMASIPQKPVKKSVNLGETGETCEVLESVKDGRENELVKESIPKRFRGGQAESKIYAGKIRCQQTR